MNLFNLGYAVSNLGLMQEAEDVIREEHPSWNDAKVAKELQKILQKATLYNAKNKKPKKPKKPKKEPEPKRKTEKDK